MLEPKNLALIGCRGCGKSTVGRLIALEWDWTLVDTDARVVATAGRSISEIFASEGECGFRRREREMIEAACRGIRQVLAVGGGAVVDPVNSRRLHDAGLVVWLTAPAGVLWKRIIADPASSASRPALTAQSGVAEIRAVLTEREPWYRRAAHHVVDASGDDPQRVASEVIRVVHRTRE